MTIHLTRTTGTPRNRFVRTASLAVAMTASVGLVAGLAACGSDGGDAGDPLGEITARAADLGYTCVNLGDVEDPNSGLSGGLSCMPSVDRLAEDPMFVVFDTDVVSTGAEAAEKAVEKTHGVGGAGAQLDLTVVRNMFAAVDGGEVTGVAGYCHDSAGHCGEMMPKIGLTSTKLVEQGF